MAEKDGVSSAEDARTKEEEAMEAERRFARNVAFGLPVATLIGAISVGLLFSLGPALLVLIAGVFLGTIALFWASLRTLSGDAPLPLELEAMAARTHRVGEVAEQKRRVLRALKDLENEHAIGKIDDADYAELAARYREEAKQVMREMDEQIEPLRERAEEIARAHLEKRKLAKKAIAATNDEEESAEDVNEAAKAKKPASTRLPCPKCETSNEPDAAFCKKCGTSLAAAEEPSDASS